MAVRELLLELAGQAKLIVSMVLLTGETRGRKKKNLPLLDTVEALQGRDGDKDDNSLLAVADFDLIRPESACELQD